MPVLTKNKDISVTITGMGTDIPSDVEWFTLTLPDTKENSTEEFISNKNTYTDNVEKTGFDDWSGMEVAMGEGGSTWSAYVAAKDSGTTGTLTISAKSGSGSAILISAQKIKFSKISGGGGDATSFATSFTPTITFIGTSTN